MWDMRKQMNLEVVLSEDCMFRVLPWGIEIV